MINHNAVDALRFEGLAFAESGNMDDAIDCFLRGLAINKSDANLHNNIANAYKKKQAFEHAISHYETAIRIDPSYAQAHNNLASLLAHQGDNYRALQHYRLAVHEAPDFTVAHYNLGLLLLKNQERFAAKTQFNNVITLNPNHMQAHFYLGALALDENAFDDAERAFQHVLGCHSEHVDALINLGVIAIKRNHGQQAIEYFTKALALDKDNVDAQNNLAATFIHHDRFENALIYYASLLEQEPTNPEYRYNAGVAEMALGHLQKAKTHFETILIKQHRHFAALTNLAAIQVRLGDRQQAVTLLRYAHEANPDDSSCQFMLNALTGNAIVPEACPDYARNLFDNYAIYYDQHMQNTLHYTLPKHIARVLHQHLLDNAPVAHALDLGCGTGLSGVVLRELSQHLTGVDLSSKMLSNANEKRLYDVLIEAELLAFLTQDVQSYHLILASDVLPYLGELASLFQAVRARLTDQGLWVFSIEVSEQAPWQLQDSARFSHHPDYINTLAMRHHFIIKHQERLVARQQADNDLHVILYVMQVA